MVIMSGTVHRKVFYQLRANLSAVSFNVQPKNFAKRK